VQHFQAAAFSGGQQTGRLYEVFALPYFIALLIIEAILLWAYLFSPLFAAKKRSLAAKCFCSAGFVAIAGCAAFLDGAAGRPFSVLMVTGLCFSFFGDLFLGIATKGLYFALGLLSFLVTHLFYIAAVAGASSRLIGNIRFWNLWEFLPVAAAMLILAAVMKWKLTFESNTDAALVAAYSLVIFTMLSKVLFFCGRLFAASAVNRVTVAALLGGGALLFVFSDLILMLMLFGGKDTKRMSKLNLLAYFTAQVMLACSILTV